MSNAIRLNRRTLLRQLFNLNINNIEEKYVYWMNQKQKDRRVAILELMELTGDKPESKPYSPYFYLSLSRLINNQYFCRRDINDRPELKYYDFYPYWR